MGDGNFFSLREMVGGGFDKWLQSADTKCFGPFLLTIFDVALLICGA